MPHIPQEVIDQVRLQADIVDVINSYIPLKKMGRDFKACCPFHNEKTPSFVVNPQRQWYHCFGCGKHGNVITFIMERENVDFPNAVMILANKYQIYIPEDDAWRSRPRDGRSPEPRTSYKERLYILHEKMQAWYAARLNESSTSPVAEYLKTRQLPPEIVAKFGIGAAPDSWDAGMNYARREGFSEEEIVTAGIAIRTDDSPPKIYDRFRNRLMFPIWNEQGRVVGFSARTIEKDFKGAKYVNSPETPVFKKGRILYALHFARQEMGKKGFAILCEGQLDVIAMHRAGYTNAVAPQGTAFTEEQATMLKRYTDTLYLAFDSDGAGTKAVFRAAELALPRGFALKVIRFPGGKDPDELMRNSGAEAIDGAVENARDFFDFSLAYLNGENGDSPAGKAATAEQMLQFISVLESDAAKAAYIEWLSRQMNLDQGALQHEMSRVISRRNREQNRESMYPRPTPAEQVIRPPEPKKDPDAERYRKALYAMLDCILADEYAAEIVSREVQPDLLDSSEYARAIDDVIQSKMLDEWSDAPNRILARYAERPIDNDLSALLMREPLAEPLPKRYVHRTLKDCLRAINLYRLNVLIREKTEALRLASPQDPRRAELVKELFELSRRRACACSIRNPLGPEPPPPPEEDDSPVPPPVEF